MQGGYGGGGYDDGYGRGGGNNYRGGGVSSKRNRCHVDCFRNAMASLKYQFNCNADSLYTLCCFPYSHYYSNLTFSRATTMDMAEEEAVTEQEIITVAVEA